MLTFIQRFFHKPKRFYFVRHGETILNAQKIRQGSQGGLSDLGKKQVAALADRIKDFPVDIIISSPYERTQETTAIINEFLHKPVEYSNLLVERRNPKEIIGRSGDDPEVKQIVDKIDKSFHEGNLRYSDEENFEDLRNRARDLLAFLETRTETHILCVTHGIFLTMVIAYMLYRETLTAEQFIKLWFFNPANNAGVTVCEFDSLKKDTDTKGWELIAWNDYGRIVE